MYPYIDMHCDTLLRSLLEGSNSIYDGDGMQSIKQMKEGGQLCQFFAIFFPPRNMPVKDPKFVLPPDEAFFQILVQNLKTEVNAHADIILMAYQYEDIIANQKAGKMSAILTVEDGRMVNGEMDKLVFMYEAGVRAISLTWNGTNCFGFPNSKEKEIMESGLTPFGKEALELMNDLGILIDVSHLSDGGFFDVAKISKKPFVATHSNCRALTPHTRNLTDEMIKLLAQKGGVAGLNFGPEFTSPDVTSRESTVENLVEHVLHFIKVGGEDCVGLGTDFDGIGGNLEIGHPAEMHLLFDLLKKKGLTERQLEKLASGNVLRVIHDAMK
ncbi:MAG: dipeptidase [Lachnospiraceae bacterium]